MEQDSPKKSSEESSRPSPLKNLNPSPLTLEPPKSSFHPAEPAKEPLNERPKGLSEPQGSDSLASVSVKKRGRKKLLQRVKEVFRPEPEPEPEHTVARLAAPESLAILLVAGLDAVFARSGKSPVTPPAAWESGAVPT